MIAKPSTSQFLLKKSQPCKHYAILGSIWSWLKGMNCIIFIYTNLKSKVMEASMETRVAKILLSNFTKYLFSIKMDDNGWTSSILLASGQWLHEKFINDIVWFFKTRNDCSYMKINYKQWIDVHGWNLFMFQSAFKALLSKHARVK